MREAFLVLLYVIIVGGPILLFLALIAGSVADDRQRRRNG